MEKIKKYSPVVLRTGISLVFLWFGASQLINPLNFIGWVPSFIGGMINPFSLVFLNGMFEVIFSLLLLIGIFTRASSFLLAIHLLGILFSVGYNEIGIRDFGLFMATLAVFLHGKDYLCLDNKMLRKKGSSY